MRDNKIIRIPIRRILERLDNYLSEKKFSEAEVLLENWMREAEAGNDIQGKLTLLNEQIGLFRKLERENECEMAINSALQLAGQSDNKNSLQIGTTYLNAATGYNAFGKKEQSLSLYKKAQQIYENVLNPHDEKMAGLYNNMALTLVSLEKFAEAEALYIKALSVLEKNEQNKADMAITYLNMADMVYAEIGAEAGENRIEEYLDQAEKLLLGDSIPHDSYYHYVCGKCAEVFGFYGRFMIKQELVRRSGSGDED